MDIEIISVNELSCDPSNARKHPEKNLEAIKASLKKFGAQKPIVIGSDNVVIAGNGTLEAAKALGWTDIKCVRSELKGAEAIAYAIADNRTQDLSEFDDAVLGQHLEALEVEEFDLSSLGFDADDMALLELPESANGKEFDESIADTVEFIECPDCGHKWPK